VDQVKFVVVVAKAATEVTGGATKLARNQRKKKN
jgi:hypothetical protein